MVYSPVGETDKKAGSRQIHTSNCWDKKSWQASVGYFLDGMVREDLFEEVISELRVEW